MNFKELAERKGVIGAGIFDTNGKLIKYYTKSLSPEQADSTALLCGVIYTLLNSIGSLYSRFCGIKFQPIIKITIESLDFSLTIKCLDKGCIGIIYNMNEIKVQEIEEIAERMVESIE
ncbi:MAG: DUF2173 family protein [Thermoplasmata archaeon]